MDASAADRPGLWRLLFITMINLLNTVEADLKDADDLTLIDIGSLFALAAAGTKGAPMGSLAALFAVDPSVITYRVKRLEGRGLVSRKISADNRRFTHAVITQEGKLLLRQARSHLLASADEHFFSHLDLAATDALPGILEPLLAAQQQSRNQPPRPRRPPTQGQSA